MATPVPAVCDNFVRITGRLLESREYVLPTGDSHFLVKLEQSYSRAQHDRSMPWFWLHFVAGFGKEFKQLNLGRGSKLTVEGFLDVRRFDLEDGNRRLCIVVVRGYEAEPVENEVLNVAR